MSTSETPRRLPDRCEACGQFVGFYPVGFYDDRYCVRCYDERRSEIGDYGAILPGLAPMRLRGEPPPHEQRVERGGSAPREARKAARTTGGQRMKVTIDTESTDLRERIADAVYGVYEDGGAGPGTLSEWAADAVLSVLGEQEGRPEFGDYPPTADWPCSGRVFGDEGDWGRCVAHGEQVGERDDAGVLRCPVVITAEYDCGYGDPCGRVLGDPSPVPASRPSGEGEKG